MTLLTDLRFALRLWRRHPTMVVVAGLSLGLGVGATTTMYSVVNKVTHYDLGFKDVDRLVMVSGTDTERGNDEESLSFEVVQALLRGSSFEAIGQAQLGGMPVTLTGSDETSRVLQMPLDVNGLAVTGIAPLLGRTHGLEDFQDLIKQKEARAIVITYDTWQRQLGGAKDVIGRSFNVDGEPRIVIGVMPRGFKLVPWADNIAFWTVNDVSRIPQAAWMASIARLKPGVTVAAAQADAAAIRRQVAESRGEKAAGIGARVVPLHEAYFGRPREILTFLLGAVSFVLLIACANVANLLLAAGTARQKELSLRAATGAGRGRLIRQLLAENMLLSLVGCGFGLILAFWGTRLFALIVPANFPDLLRDIRVDARVLGFALAVSIGSSLVFGLVPALRASRVDLVEVLKEGGRSGTGGRRRGRSALLVAEVSLSMVLLVGAGLMMRALLREQGNLPGFDTHNLMSADILLGGTKYFEKTPADLNRVTPEVEAFYDRVLERVRAIPGVARAGIASRIPIEVWQHPFTITGRPAPDPGKEPRADFNEVDAQLLDTLAIKLLRGRLIEERDTASSPWVVVVNKAFVDRYFPGADPIGQSIRFAIGPGGKDATPEPQAREIVGVVANVAYPSFFTETPAAAYVPFRQHMAEYGREDEWIHTRKALLVRGAVDPLTLVRAVGSAVHEVDPDQTAHGFMTLEQRVAQSPSITNSRFFATLFTTFGVLAILLAMVGVYGVMSWVVSQRTSEFGIRMALGARASDVVRMLLGQSLRPIVVGLALGALGGFGLSRALKAMFFFMASADPAVFTAIAGLMLAAALVAAWLPVHRVTRIDPQKALRCD
jgi:putative ABC transport system permease protein